jgi:Raf kinase inhibitor-like YbhB/YbcL family protein
MLARRRQRFFIPSLLAIASGLLCVAAGCKHGGDEPVAPHNMRLTVVDAPAGVLPAGMTCDGAGTSPQLTWTYPPEGTQSLALVVTDRDSRFGYNFIHWVLFNVPADVHMLPADIEPSAPPGSGGMQGANDGGKTGYYPPCPPKGSSHHYDFVLYAVDRRVDLASASKRELLDALRNHVLGEAETVVTYRR